jgi:catechol 2,3-dioxygenase-like lactoylglutathione lyase family enzyme
MANAAPSPGLLAHPPERLHHYAFVVKDHEVNRAFIEDVLGIPLVATWCERTFNAVAGREIDFCHTFFALGDGGALAFFQYADDDVYEQLKPTNPETGHHISFKVVQRTYDEIAVRLGGADVAYRETDHGYCLSLYVTSPDGLRLEFTVDPDDMAEIDAARRADCHAELARWLAGDHRTNNDIRG